MYRFMGRILDRRIKKIEEIGDNVNMSPNMKIASAKIYWLLKRNEIPRISKRKNTNYIYNPIIVFQNQYDCPIWNDNKSTVPLWTVIISNKKIRGRESIATLRYVVDNAPQELMQSNAKFELFDGKKKVADGVIIDII